jgi:hypothetical protein
LAESSGSKPYAAQKAAVSARSGSHGNSSYGTPSGASAASSLARPAGSWSSIAAKGTMPGMRTAARS